MPTFQKTSARSCDRNRPQVQRGPRRSCPLFPLLSQLPRQTAWLLHWPKRQVLLVCSPSLGRCRDMDNPRVQRFPPQSVATICLQHAQHRGGRTRPFVTSAFHASELQPNICILLQYACSNRFLRCAWQAPLLTRGARDAFLRTALGTIGSLCSALAGHHDGGDVICLPRHAVNNPTPPLRSPNVVLCESRVLSQIGW